MTKAAYFCDNEKTLNRVYSKGNRERIAACCDMHSVIVTSQNLGSQLPLLSDLEVIFSTWGMPAMTRARLELMPRLKAVFYAAGSVKAFAPVFLEQGVVVVSAWAANAVPVAEFTLAQILLANKGYFRNIRDCASPAGRSNAFAGEGNFEQTVALLGAGMIGRKVIDLMKPFRLRAVVFDPFLSGADAEKLCVEKVGLDDAFKRGMVVSNHLANVPGTRGILAGKHFNSMRENAVFINTGRGATVVEGEMIEVLRKRQDLTALLDVTDPEPPEPGSALYTLPNVTLSGHIAGAIGGEVTRMSDTAIEEFLGWREGRALRYAVTTEMLKTMA